MTVRIIPRLDIKGPNVVKGVHLEGLRVLGSPDRFARHYYENGADELFYMDTVASLYGRNSLDDIIEKTAAEIFIPLTVGGGIREVEDVRRVLRAGADKVAINTAAIQRPDFIREASRTFGSSTIVISIEAIRHSAGKYEAYCDYGRESTGIDAIDWARKATDLGAGELVVTSINQEGTGKGFDIELTAEIADAVPIPVIAHGGGGNAEHVFDVFDTAHAQAVCLASLLHYNVVRDNNPIDSQSEGNVEFLKRRDEFSVIKDRPLPELKSELIEMGLDCRPVTIDANFD
jgi:imidazole glycerol-phosphate synthase subunit HisF